MPVETFGCGVPPNDPEKKNLAFGHAQMLLFEQRESSWPWSPSLFSSIDYALRMRKSWAQTSHSATIPPSGL